MNIVFNCYTCSVSLCYIFLDNIKENIQIRKTSVSDLDCTCHFNVILRDSVCAVHITHALIKDITQSKDCKSVQETLSTDRNEHAAVIKFLETIGGNGNSHVFGMN